MSSPRTVALAVLPATGRSAVTLLAQGKHPVVKKSKSSRARAIVLTLVHVAIAAHVVQWLVTGLTVSPVEPSESMYALEVGKVNAGFIFFIIAIAATLVFGRFFCGWGCHIIALQDMCTHLMNRIGVRPRPFRSRLMVWVPFVLACYMFVWPTVRREVMVPLVGLTRDGLASQFAKYELVPAQFASMLQEQPVRLPWFMGESAPFPGFRNAIMTEDFWATFPPWFVTIPFLFVCSCGIVYFLGNKGFCTYACPYGGFFGPADRFAPGRIIVNDNCEGCGHCTAVCTSNVRVHQEVRDYGMVVDAGCMKCMDCVSVCPKDALSFGFALPPALGGGSGVAQRADAADAGSFSARPSAKTRRGKFFLSRLAKAEPAKPKLTKPKLAKPKLTKPKLAKPKPAYDLSVRGELVFAVAAFASFWAFRGFLGLTPMLMAAAIGGIHAFCLWKIVQMIRLPNVRLQSLQLRSRGRVSASGMVFVLCTCVLTLLACWAGFIKFERLRFERIDSEILTPQAVAFAKGYVPTPEDKLLAERGLAIALRSGSMRDVQALASDSAAGARGLGWHQPPGNLIRIGWLAAVANDRPLAERALKEATLRGRANPEVLQGLATLMQLRGAPRAEFEQSLQASLAAQPKAQHVRVMLAQMKASAGDVQSATTLINQVFAAGRQAEEGALRGAAELQARMGDVPGARAALEAAIVKRPLAASAKAFAATLAGVQGDHAAAVKLAREARKIEPRNPAHVQLHASALAAGGNVQEGISQLRAWIARGEENARAGVAERQLLVQLLLSSNAKADALPVLDEIIELLPQEAGPKLDKAAILRELGKEKEAAAIEASLQGIGGR